jgi:DNA polymerase elongation subunit (family B)
MMKVFFDTEFTHLEEPDLPEPAELISIGCISEDGKKFYAENADFNKEACSLFVEDTVFPLLEGGDVSMPYEILAKQLRNWIESFNTDVVFYTDAPSFDWPFVEHLFETWGWPSNLSKKPEGLNFMTMTHAAVFENASEQAFITMNLRRHHALDDAIANKYGYEQVIRRWL